MQHLRKNPTEMIRRLQPLLGASIMGRGSALQSEFTNTATADWSRSNEMALVAREVVGQEVFLALTQVNPLLSEVLEGSSSFGHSSGPKLSVEAHPAAEKSCRLRSVSSSATV